MLNIVSSNFSFNIGPQQCAAGTGLSIVLYNTSYISDISIDGVVAYQGRPSIFCNNSSIAGGGMAIYGSSYIVVSPQIGIAVNFTANHASYRRGLYVDQFYQAVLTVFFQTTSTQESYNPVNATILLSMQEYC